jgi:hypothetical protein
MFYLPSDMSLFRHLPLCSPPNSAQKCPKSGERGSKQDARYCDNNDTFVCCDDHLLFCVSPKKDCNVHKPLHKRILCVRAYAEASELHIGATTRNLERVRIYGFRKHTNPHAITLAIYQKRLEILLLALRNAGHAPIRKYIYIWTTGQERAPAKPFLRYSGENV